MANRTRVIEVLAPVLGMNPMTLDRILRDLAAKKYVPRVAPGKRSPHYDLLDLAHTYRVSQNNYTRAVTYRQGIITRPL